MQLLDLKPPCNFEILISALACRKSWQHVLFLMKLRQPFSATKRKERSQKQNSNAYLLSAMFQQDLKLHINLCCV
jgi:hypothetical protein